MAMPKTLLVFTGGGLAPALNPTIYGVVTAARENGWRVLGGLHGWASLLKGGRQVDLTELNIEPLKENGGTILRSSRTNPYATPDGPAQVSNTLHALGVDAVVAIGGDDTLGAAARLAADGIPVVGIPKTVDNDLLGTYFTPGFPSAAYYLASFTDETKRDSAYALSRIYIIEVGGMRAGWLACAGALGGADIVLLPEWPLNWRQVKDRLSETYRANGNFAVAVISQEAQFDEEPLRAVSAGAHHDQYEHTRHSFICIALRDRIRAELGIDTQALYPGSYVQSGKPIPLDRDLAIELGKKAVELLADGVTGQMTCIKRPDPSALALTVSTVPLKEVAAQKYRPLDPEMYDPAALFPTKTFLDYMAPLIRDFPKFSGDAYTTLLHEIAGSVS